MGTAFKELFKLYDLIQNGDARSVKSFLLDNAIDVNIILPCKGIGVLHLAVGVDPLDKSRECTELLLKHGADPNLCNDDGLTPLHIASIWGRVDNLRVLVGCGGDPAIKDLDQLSSFEYAVREQQWEVYDYLKNVVELSDDEDTRCAYTLDLDKILVTTDQVIAEYEPITEEQTKTNTYRKSEMIRDWCDTNSLIINKLYPTILSETYLLEPLNNNITLDLTYLSNCRSQENDSKYSYDNFKSNSGNCKENDSRNSNNFNYNSKKDCKEVDSRNSFKSNSRKDCKEIDWNSNNSFKSNSKNCKEIDFRNSNNSFKTCQSNRSVNITGVKKLELTDSDLKRASVYENFSLPGSPQNITHRNYNTKSSVKNKSQTKAQTLCSDFDMLSIDSSDGCLDKAIAVVQNKTNEWLSGNTRRSSASSGVSSAYCAGTVLLASLTELYKYEDKQEEALFYEKRLLVTPVVLPVEETPEGTADESIVSIASSLPTTLRHDDATLRAELLKLGFTPGPIQDSTRTLYLRKLKELKKNPPPPPVANGKSYSIEMAKSLRSDEWMQNLSIYEELDKKARDDFTCPTKTFREGKSKTSFTYLLLDPRLTDNLPAKDGQNKLEMWTTFVNSIFYVGKGKRSRPYAHLYQALTLWKRGFTTSNDKKIQHILDIWHNKLGVICLHIFQNVIPAEAFTYEAAMIDVIGISNLKNLKGGTYYGLPATWPHKDRRMLGLYLLYKAMRIFLNEGERHLRPDDI